MTTMKMYNVEVELTDDELLMMQDQRLLDLYDMKDNEEVEIYERQPGDITSKRFRIRKVNGAYAYVCFSGVHGGMTIGENDYYVTIGIVNAPEEIIVCENNLASDDPTIINFGITLGMRGFSAIMKMFKTMQAQAIEESQDADCTGRIHCCGADERRQTVYRYLQKLGYKEDGYMQFKEWVLSF